MYLFYKSTELSFDTKLNLLVFGSATAVVLMIAIAVIVMIVKHKRDNPEQEPIREGDAFVVEDHTAEDQPIVDWLERIENAVREQDNRKVVDAGPAPKPFRRALLRRVNNAESEQRKAQQIVDKYDAADAEFGHLRSLEDPREAYHGIKQALQDYGVEFIEPGDYAWAEDELNRLSKAISIEGLKSARAGDGRMLDILLELHNDGRLVDDNTDVSELLTMIESLWAQGSFHTASMHESKHKVEQGVR